METEGEVKKVSLCVSVHVGVRVCEIMNVCTCVCEYSLVCAYVFVCVHVCVIK